MKTFNLFFIITLIFAISINAGQALDLKSGEKQNSNNVICEKKDDSEIFYIVNAFYPKGEVKDNDTEYNTYLNDLIEYIHYVIVKNRSNYQNPKEIDNIEKTYEDRKSIYEREYGQYGTVYRVIENKENGYILLMAYLNNKNIDEVRNIPGVVSVNRPTTYEIERPTTTEEKDDTICFEVDDTVAEPIEAPKLPSVEQKEKKLVCEPREPSEGFYNIKVNYEYEDFILEDPDFRFILEGYMLDIDNIIYEYKESYQDYEKVKELHRQFNSEYSNDKMDYDNSGSVKASTLNEDEGIIILSAYLSPVTLNKVKKLDFVSSVEQSSEGTTDEYCHEVEIDSIPEVTATVDVVPTPETTIAVEVDDVQETGSDSEEDDAQCFSLSLGYQCCSQGAEVQYVDNDGEWGYENNEWCGISN